MTCGAYLGLPIDVNRWQYWPSPFRNMEATVDRLDAMSVLLAVVDSGSLSAGARRLGIPLTTVSRKVAELETHLRTRLLNRSSRQITLTEPGQSYVAACRQI